MWISLQPTTDDLPSMCSPEHSILNYLPCSCTLGQTKQMCWPKKCCLQGSRLYHQCSLVQKWHDHIQIMADMSAWFPGTSSVFLVYLMLFPVHLLCAPLLWVYLLLMEIANTLVSISSPGDIHGGTSQHLTVQIFSFFSSSQQDKEDCHFILRASTEESCWSSFHVWICPPLPPSRL